MSDFETYFVKWRTPSGCHKIHVVGKNHLAAQLSGLKERGDIVTELFGMVRLEKPGTE